jgi:peptide/nickel transport system ATP-binding protein
MERVGIPDAARRFDLFPHEFSGGQCQRIMIAIALAGEPDVLIADEPTTALDVTIQAQILDLLNQIRQETGMAIVFISHDLGAVSQICERVCVMYAGRIVETAQTSELFETPKHPYTLGLFDAIPRLDGGRERLRAIPGTVPDPRHLPQGCAFAPRCSQATEQCEKHIPELRQLNAQKVACFNVVDVIKTTFIEAGNAHRTIGAEGATA